MISRSRRLKPTPYLLLPLGFQTNHEIENSTGVFAIGTLLATDDLVADEVQALGLEVKGRQLGWVTAWFVCLDAYRGF